MNKSVHVSEIVDRLANENALLVDVRERGELEETGFVPGAHHLPMSTLDLGDPTLTDNKDKTIYVMCRSGRRSENVQNSMIDEGFDAVNVEGGILEYDGDVDKL